MPDLDTELDTLCASVAALARTVDEMRDRHRSPTPSDALVEKAATIIVEALGESNWLRCKGVASAILSLAMLKERGE